MDRIKENEDGIHQKEKKLTVAVIAANNQTAAITAAIVVEKERLKNKFNFNPNQQVFIINPKKIIKINLSDFDRLYIVGIRPEDMGEAVFNNFLIHNHQKIHLWYNEKNIAPAGRVVLENIIKKPKKLFLGISLNNYVTYFNDKGKRKINPLIVEFTNALEALRTPKKSLANNISERFRKTLRMAKVNDDWFSPKKKTKFFDQALKELVVELIKKEESAIVFKTLMEYDDMINHHEQTKQSVTNHPIIGKIMVIKPATSEAMLNKKFFFESFLKDDINAVAIKDFSANPKGDIFEVCLKKSIVAKIDLDDFPIIKQIADCRFLVDRNFIFADQTEK